MSEKSKSMTKKIRIDQELLVDHKIPKYPVIKEIITKATKIISNVSVIKILSHNIYEKLVPFNLWFRNPNYKIINNHENNQNIRIRCFNSAMLTPLVSNDNNNLQQIKSFLPVLSMYQPFYPETFYSMWEILQMKHLNTQSKFFLHIGLEKKLGSIEALIFYHEKYQQTYQYNVYHSWLAGGETVNKNNNSYNLLTPNINYLDQAYKIYFLQSTNELVEYDFISIDCIHLLDDIFKWKYEEYDLQATLFYILTSLHHLKTNGSMLLRLNMIACKSWTIIFDILNNFFSEYIFIRPITVNPFNSEIYLFLDKFEYKDSLHSISNKILKNLYIQEIYRKFNVNPEINNNSDIYGDPSSNNQNLILKNPITEKYLISVEQWSNKLSIILDNFQTINAPKNDYVMEWHQSHDLKQIKDLSNEFDNKALIHILKTSAKEFAIKPIPPNGLYDKQFYKKLIEKRADLNYYKRVMDTKPSQIFQEHRQFGDKNTYLLTWEQLSNKIDTHRDLKYILKKQYNAEMVTNAWIKMYEMLNMFPDLIPSNETIKTFHLCEAPGAFISALNHFLSNKDQKMDWYAQTLKPTNTGSETNAALEDHFGLISAYPNRWLFGDINDESGDITHSTIIKSYVKNPVLKNLDFMTADAGLQCHPTELNEQEAYLGKINMGQIICILACLPINKSAIFKTFLPMSEPLTISMMYLTTHLFTAVSIVKPTTSHSSNSEVYIVLRGYKGIDQNTLEILYGLLDDPKITSKTLLFPKIDMSFFSSYMSNVSSFIDRQIQSLTTSYFYYYNMDKLEQYQKTIDDCTDDWLRLNPIFLLKNSLLDDMIF